jgi:mRNA interferase MazF
MDMVRRFDIWMISLDPVIGSEIRKTRPCVIVSPNEVNQHLKTVTVVPLTSSLKTYPTRVPIQFQNKQGEMAVDQIRSIDKARLLGRLGQLDQKTARRLCDLLVQTFRY